MLLLLRNCEQFFIWSGKYLIILYLSTVTFQLDDNLLLGVNYSVLTILYYMYFTGLVTVCGFILNKYNNMIDVFLCIKCLVKLGPKSFLFCRSVDNPTLCFR